MLKTEYEGYLKELNEHGESIRSDSPQLVSKELISLCGRMVRVGQVLADLEIEYANDFSRLKVGDTTDKLAKSQAEMKIVERHGISKSHFERMYKNFETLGQAMKKRLAVLDSEVKGYM